MKAHELKRTVNKKVEKVRPAKKKAKKAKGGRPTNKGKKWTQGGAHKGLKPGKSAERNRVYSRGYHQRMTILRRDAAIGAEEAKIKATHIWNTYIGIYTHIYIYIYIYIQGGWGVGVLTWQPPRKTPTRCIT